MTRCRAWCIAASVLFFVGVAYADGKRIEGEGVSFMLPAGLSVLALAGCEIHLGGSIDERDPTLLVEGFTDDERDRSLAEVLAAHFPGVPQVRTKDGWLCGTISFAKSTTATCVGPAADGKPIIALLTAHPDRFKALGGTATVRRLGATVRGLKGCR